MADTQNERNNYVSHTDFVGTDFTVNTVTATTVLTVTSEKFLSDNPYKFLLELDVADYTGADETYELQVYTNSGSDLIGMRPILPEYLTVTETALIYAGDFSMTFEVPRSAITTDITIVVEATAGATVNIQGRAKIVEGSE